MPNVNSSKNNNNGKFLNRTNKQSIPISNHNHINTTPTMDTNENDLNTGWTTYIYKCYHSSFSNPTLEQLSPNEQDGTTTGLR